MTIQQGNLKLLAAVVMDDADNNGGPPSSNVIPDGSSNTVFPDISELDRAGGRVQFRKIFPWVDEAATSTFYGANACLSDIPVDANTGCVLFEAASVSETQADVIARIGGVTGSLPAGFASLISTEIYLRINHSDPAQKYRFDVSDPLGSGFSSTVEVGTQLTLLEFSAGSVVKYETKTVETVDTVDLTHPGAYYAILGLSAGVHSSWSAVAAGSYWSDLVAPDAYGTYVIIGSGGASLSTDDFAYFGATLLTSGITSGATVLPVAATSQPVVPVDLIGTPDADTIIGFDPALLTKSPTGEEPILQAGRFVVIGKTISAAPTTVSNAQVINLGETGLSRVRVIGDNGNVITAGYTADLEAGTVTFDNVAGYSQPVTVTGRVEDMARVLSIAGLNVTISRAVTHDYPSGSTVSAAVIFGDLRARVGDVWDQQTWPSNWDDTGTPAAAQYNQYAYPIVVTNSGAITERWRLHFTNTTSFNIIGEQVGQIAVGDTLSTAAPINPATGEPYFSIDPLGFGAGWSAGNVLRFSTQGAQAPVWVMRVIQSGPDSGAPDSFELAIRGDVDRP